MQFQPIGRLSFLPPSTKELVKTVHKETCHFTERILSVALSYGGRSEIIDAIQELVKDVELGKLDRIDINEENFSQYLLTSGIPDPDLLIRTSGEARISNFLLWQIAYTELYFTKTLWPDFRHRDILLALLDYQKRERRFGRVSHPFSPQNV